MKKAVFTFIFFCISIIIMQAQYRLTGEITNEKGDKLAYVNIQVLSTDSTFLYGTSTDNLGIFHISNLETKKVLLSVSCIGYIPQVIAVKIQNNNYRVPPIILQTDLISLSEVKVTGSSFIRQKDHLLVIPDKHAVKHAFNGYDLLYNLMIPGLAINRKEKTITTLTGEATLYINGVKATMREVQNLQPKDVEKVEYYVLPTSGLFTGDAASINYITKVYNSGGYITLDGVQNIGYLKGDYNLGAKLSYKQTTFTLFTGHNMSKHSGTEYEKEEYFLFPTNPIDKTTHSDNSDYKNNQQYTQLKISHDTQKQHLSATASWIRNYTPHDDRIEHIKYQGAENSTIQSQETSNNKNQKVSLLLGGILNITDKQQLKFNLNGAYSQNKYNRVYQENNWKSETDVQEKLYYFEPYIAYIYQPNENNSFYGRIFHVHNITSTHYCGDNHSWQHLWSGETVGLFDYTLLFNDKLTMMISPGFSWQNYKLHKEALQSSWNFRTNSWIRYVINNRHWVGFGFSMGNNQPDICYLNTVDQTIDRFQTKRGNPLLNYTHYYQWYFMHEGQIDKVNLQSRLWYSKDQHTIYTDYFLENNKLISTFNSKGSFNTANAELSASYRFMDKLRTHITVGYSFLYVPHNKQLEQHNVKVSCDINYFIKSFAFNAYFKSQEKILDKGTRSFIKQPVSYGFSIRYNSKNWMAEVGTDNPFSKHLHYSEQGNYKVYHFNLVKTNRTYQQTAYIKLAYTFDYGKKTARESNNVDCSINSTILKAR